MTQATTRTLAAAIAVVAAIATFSLYSFSAQAQMPRGGDRGGDEGTEIEVENKAHVSNELSVQAKTGNNEAEGGDGGRGGDGGDVSRGFGGAGGTGGNGGNGGTVISGYAEAIGTIHNDVNSTRVSVEACGCDEPRFGRSLFFPMLNGNDEEEPIEIEVENKAYVRNGLDVDAKTGGNEVDGGDGGSGDDGGDARTRSYRSWNMWFSWLNNSVGGKGGNGGTGGTGGTVLSGDAYADGLLNNLVNETVVRVHRGTDVEE
jgi:hypothetical protein